MIYNVKVDKKVISIVGDDVLIRGNIEIDYLHAEFDGEWDDMERINCIFYGGTQPKKMPLIDGSCEIPWEALEEAEEVRLTFAGYDDDDEDADRRIVTRAMTNAYEVKAHGYLDGDDPAEPTPDAYTELRNRIAELESNQADPLPEGGTAGQVLTKSEDGGEAWAALPTQVQPDWEQMDETAADFVKNKPCGVVPEFLPIVDGAILTFEDMSGANCAENPFELELLEGSIYIVDWNGVAYRRACYRCPEMDTAVLGNASLLGFTGGEDEPFLIGGEDGTVLIVSDTAEPATMGLHVRVGVIKTLPEEYLPETVATKDYVEELLGVIADGSY